MVRLIGFLLRSPLTGKPVSVIAAGGIFDGRGLAMALSFGADAVWVGTRCSGRSGWPSETGNGDHPNFTSQQVLNVTGR